MSAYTFLVRIVVNVHNVSGERGEELARSELEEELGRTAYRTDIVSCENEEPDGD